MGLGGLFPAKFVQLYNYNYHEIRTMLKVDFCQVSRGLGKLLVGETLVFTEVTCLSLTPCPGGNRRANRSLIALKAGGATFCASRIS